MRTTTAVYNAVTRVVRPVETGSSRSELHLDIKFAIIEASECRYSFLMQSVL